MAGEHFGYFGYGSLVNAETRATDAQAAIVRVHGWKRQWRHCVSTDFGKVCALTVRKCPSVSIDGAVVFDRRCNLPALDRRETGYAREKVTVDWGEAKPMFSSVDIQLYVGKKKHCRWADEEFPIWKSYLMCVLVGYLRELGTEGVHDFIYSTEGWECPVLDDSADPKYPRAGRVLPDERRAINNLLPDLQYI